MQDHIQEVVVLDVLDPVCVYPFISVEIKTWTFDFEELQYCCAVVCTHCCFTLIELFEPKKQKLLYQILGNWDASSSARSAQRCLSCVQEATKSVWSSRIFEI